MSLLDPLNRILPSKAAERRGDGRRRMPPSMPPSMPSATDAAWLHDGDATAFRHNPVVHRCVRMIAEACAAIPLRLTEGASQLAAHPLLTLINRPNAHQSGVEMRDTLVAQLLLYGNAYLERSDAATEVDMLHVLRPDRVRLVCDQSGWPAYYEYRAAGQKVRHDANQTPCRVLHFRLADPQGDHIGLSPLKAAALAVALHDAANRWNKSLFDNAARPSGALVYRGSDGQRLSDAQFDRLKTELQDNFQGAQNAGRPLLLEGGLDWSSISMSPQDMDFIAVKHSAARDIALAFGVPPMLLGIPGDNSYANYAEANRAFWRQTVWPLTGRILAVLERCLCADTNLQLGAELDAVPALADERRTLWRRIDGAGFLTRDEKRAAVGYPPLDDAETAA